MKRMLLLLLLLVVGAFSHPADIEKEYTLGNGKKIEFDLKTGGRLSITGQEGDKVTVKVYGQDDDRTKVDIEETAAGLEISTSAHGHQNRQSSDLRFEITVPKKTDLEIESMGGAITIDGVEGKMTGETMGGELTLTNLHGTIDLKTMGGEVTLTKSDVDGSVSTNGGAVRVEDVTGNVKGHSMGGAVIYKNVVDRKGTTDGEEMSVSTMDGDIDIPDAANGANVSTMGGDITIASAKKHVKAKTMGGNIRIGSLDGSVKAETMGGDVDVYMTGDPSGDHDVYLSSMGGAITLEVPEKLPMDVDITLAYTKDADETYDIISDFSVEKTHTDKWDRTDGSPRKYIYGKGAVNGGKNRIHLSTINGNIYLKKAGGKLREE